MLHEQLPDGIRSAWQLGRLSAVPAGSAGERLEPGIRWPVGEGVEAPVLFVPSSLPDGPVPLVVFLHGAGSDPLRALPMVQRRAEQQGVLVLLPKSFDYTWDLLRGGFDRDVGGIDRALLAVFHHFEVDSRRLAIGGFSDGASYALSLALLNGELFTHVLAFSPGFVSPERGEGYPPVFISHGLSDPVLPIERCGRRVTRTLQSEGYPVDYREFFGGHEVPPELVDAAFESLR